MNRRNFIKAAAAIPAVTLLPEATAKEIPIVGSWDFIKSLGDTIKEKYDSLATFVQDHMRGLASPDLWIATSPEISSIFETASNGFEPVYKQVEIIEGMPMRGMYAGIMHFGSDWFTKIKLYKTFDTFKDEILIGGKFKLKVVNYIW